MTSAGILKLALRIDGDYRAQYENYRAACDADRRNGFRPHYCEHGTDQWTDYDNICGGCEDGNTLAESSVNCPAAHWVPASGRPTPSTQAVIGVTCSARKR